MEHAIRRLNNLKQALLIVSILYFYGLAFAFQFKRETYGLDHPVTFAVVGVLFLAALLLEAGFTWWHRRKRILWGALVALSYGILGLIIAPLLYGGWIYPIALLLPVVVVFLFGFAYSVSHVLYQAIITPMKLSVDDINVALKDMPGWELLSDGIEKTYRFDHFGEALNFVNQCGLVAEKHHHNPDIEIHGHEVKLRLRTRDEGGVTRVDIEVAREIDKI